MTGMGRGTVPPQLRRLGAAVAVALALPFVLAAPASPAAPCWQRLMLDYYDGTIDARYAIPCYEQAIANLREDELYYSSAEDDIRRALALRIAGGNGGGGGDDGTVTAADEPASSGGDGGVPTPLVVLGGVAVLLVGVGAAGIVRRRLKDDGSAPS
jgi:hypothetical protein